MKSWKVLTCPLLFHSLLLCQLNAILLDANVITSEQYIAKRKLCVKVYNDTPFPVEVRLGVLKLAWNKTLFKEIVGGNLFFKEKHIKPQERAELSFSYEVFEDENIRNQDLPILEIEKDLEHATATLKRTDKCTEITVSQVYKEQLERKKSLASLR